MATQELLYHVFVYKRWFEEATGEKPTAANVRKRFKWSLPLVTRRDWKAMYEGNKHNYPDIQPRPLKQNR